LEVEERSCLVSKLRPSEEKKEEMGKGEKEKSYEH
jgi:hypothetical protein